MKIHSGIKGLIFGILCSFIVSMLFMFISQGLAGGVTSVWGEKWLYFSAVIPFAITFTLLGVYFHNRSELSNKKLWLISLICAFFVTLYSGTIGAIVGETIVRGGMETINIKGTFIWGIIYTFVLLPLTTPFARLLIKMFHKIIKR